MWNIVNKTIQIFRFSISLRNPIHNQPLPIQKLREKFYGNQNYVGKLEYLESLEVSSKLDSFYEDKPVDLLNQEEIYYLFNSNIDYKFNNKLRKEIITKIQSTFFKCLLAKEFGEIDEVEEYLIAISFNENVLEMELQEIMFCIQVISTFKVGQKHIDETRLQKLLGRLEYGQEETLIVFGHLTEMNINCKWDINRSWQQYRKTLPKQVKLSFSLIYFLRAMQQKELIKLTEVEKERINHGMKDTLSGFEFNSIERKHLEFIYKYYEKHLEFLNIRHFSPHAYVNYLCFYQEHQSPKPSIPAHVVPAIVISNTTINQFYQILELRVQLKLDDCLSIAKSLPSFFKQSMKAVNAFFKFYRNYKIQHHKEIKLERAERAERIQKAQLAQKGQKSQKNQKSSKPERSERRQQMKKDNNETSKTLQQKQIEYKSLEEQIKYFIEKVANEKFSVKFLAKDDILKEYDFNGTIHFLANLSKHECGSYIFWGRVLNWLQIRILKDHEQKTSEISQQNYANLLHLVLNKVFKERVRQIVYEQIIKLLINPNIQVPFSFLSNICKVLEGSRVGENKIWFLIEERANNYLNQARFNKNYAKDLNKMAYSFNIMNKGSATFWNHLNALLDDNFKKNLIKNDDSLAQIHLSIKKETSRRKKH